jgi:hypothetical protein
MAQDRDQWRALVNTVFYSKILTVESALPLHIFSGIQNKNRGTCIDQLKRNTSVKVTPLFQQLKTTSTLRMGYLSIKPTDKWTKRL